MLYQYVTSLLAARQVVAQGRGLMHNGAGFDMMQSRGHVAVQGTSSYDPQWDNSLRLTSRHSTMTLKSSKSVDMMRGHSTAGARPGGLRGAVGPVAGPTSRSGTLCRGWVRVALRGAVVRDGLTPVRCPPDHGGTWGTALDEIVPPRGDLVGSRAAPRAWATVQASGSAPWPWRIYQ
jgi:hypothetical protein